MHVVGHDVIQHALVMRDEHHRVVGRDEAVHAARHHPKSVDIETRIGFVEDGQARLEQRHLQNLIALFLAAREALVHRAVEERCVHFEELHLRAHIIVEFERVELVFAARRLHRVVGESQESAVRDPGNLDRVLETEEQPRARARLRRHLE